MSEGPDPREVLAAVREGEVPTTWQVLHPRRQWLLESVFGIMWIMFGVYLAVMGISALTLMGIWPGVCFAVPTFFVGLGLFWVGGKFLKRSRRPPTLTQTLVLMPEGVVNDGPMGGFLRLSYADILTLTARIEGLPGMKYAELYVRLRDGGFTTIQLDRRFGSPEKLADRIIEGFAAYYARGDNGTV